MVPLVANLRAAALALACIGLLSVTDSSADEKNTSKRVEKGQRVFTCGHSFHVFMPRILDDIAKKAGIKDHKFAGISSIGGSRVIQHWNVADQKNKAKEALREG